MYLLLGGTQILASVEARGALFGGFARILGAELSAPATTEGIQRAARAFELAVQVRHRAAARLRATSRPPLLEGVHGPCLGL